MTDTLDLPLTPPVGGEILHQSDRCTLIWGDCTDPAVIASVPAGYGLLCTDPPYGMSYRSNMRAERFDRIAGDDGTVNWPAVLAEWVGPIGTDSRGGHPRGMANHRHVYVFGYRPENLAGPLRLSGTAELIWDKVGIGMGDLSLPWGPGHELIVFGTHSKYKAGRARNEGALAARLRQGSVIRVMRPNATGVTRHSTEKPVELMGRLVESSTVRGDLVVDPCAGSGSTLVAAILGGRRAFGVEIDRRYAELAVTRVKAAEKIANLIAAS